MSARERVRARVTLGGRVSLLPDPTLSDSSARLVVRVEEVTVAEGTVDEGTAGEGTAGDPGGYRLPVEEYRHAEPDPLHSGAAEQLQHLTAHHPEAIDVLSRLCDRQVLIGVTRILPIALDRYGIVLRVERLRDHRDVRLPFGRRIDTGAEAATQMRLLLAHGARHRPCGR